MMCMDEKPLAQVWSGGSGLRLPCGSPSWLRLDPASKSQLPSSQLYYLQAGHEPVSGSSLVTQG